MGLVVSPLQAFGGDVGIDLRRDQVRVTKQFLDAPQISPRIEQVRGKTMPELVGCELRVQSGDLKIFF